MDLKTFTYQEIIDIFNDDWDFSYLNYDEMQEVLNFPVKMNANYLEHILQKDILPKDVTFLIIVKKTEDYDYSIGSIFDEVCQKCFPELMFSKFWCNYKYAAVKSGLGQYAKNSLFYHPKFQFETHLYVVMIFNPIINLPKRNPENFNLLKQCEGCNDCFNVCPVKAIHNQSGFTWIDMEKCDNFCFYGNHSSIPSIKQNHVLLKDLSEDEKINIHSHSDYNKLFPNQPLTSGIEENGKIYWYQYPTCRECTSQKRCSKYNGNYPYKDKKPKIKMIVKGGK